MKGQAAPAITSLYGENQQHADIQYLIYISVADVNTATEQGPGFQSIPRSVGGTMVMSTQI